MKTAEPNLDDDDVTGDVKYHHGADGDVRHADRHEDRRRCWPTIPRHLEAVDGVVEGMTRGLQTDHTRNVPRYDAQIAAPILIHGDAAFAAQGVVAEVLNLQALPGYATGGTIHIISNNQIGFTTDPMRRPLDALRIGPWRRASTCRSCTSTPTTSKRASPPSTWRSTSARKFGRDVLIDLIGYRRFGHNEQDEPAYTQPQMYERIKSHPTVRELFAAQARRARRAHAPSKSQAMQDAATARMHEAHNATSRTRWRGQADHD